MQTQTSTPLGNQEKPMIRMPASMPPLPKGMPALPKL